jgi:hypothetical protein
MERDQTPPWAKELRDFTEFSLGRLATRRIGNVDVRIADRFGRLESDVANLKARGR